MDESDLILKAKEGDKAALAELFDLHGPALRGVAFKILKEEDGVGDALQIVWVKVLENIGTFDPHKGAKLSTWLHTITKNTCLDVLRKRKRRPEEGEEGEEGEEQESEGGSEWISPTGKKGWIEHEDDPRELLIAAENERELEEARKRIEQIESQFRERILIHVRPAFFKAIRDKWHIRADKDFLKGLLTKDLLTDPESEFEGLIRMVEQEYPQAKHGLPRSNEPGERITEKPSVQFFLDPQFSYRNDTEGNRKTEFDLIRIEILAPGSSQGAQRFLDKAERDLARLGFDDRFRESYRENANLAFEKYLRSISTLVAGEILDEFCSILERIRGDFLWGILVTDPETGEGEEVARLYLQARGTTVISLQEKGAIISKFLDVDRKEEKRLIERIKARYYMGKWPDPASGLST